MSFLFEKKNLIKFILKFYVKYYRSLVLVEKLKIKVDVFNKNFEKGILYFIFYNSFDVLESEISFKIWKVVFV